MTEQRPFFSIIIPVYNGLGNGLRTCLDSIWGQSLKEELYEVICVDDCSTDDTRTWLKEQKKQHSNLVIIENNENVRQGGSRNHGMKVARGTFIILIDQDDYFHNESISIVYNHLNNNNLEVLIVDCAYQYPGFISNKLQHNFQHREIMTGDEQIEKNSIPYAPWKFIFLKSLIIENNLFFIEKERIEDVDWVHRLVHYAKRTQYQPILMIHYNKSNISTTMTAYRSKEIIYSSLRLAKRMNDMINTTFKDSSDAVIGYLKWLLAKEYYLPIRSYFFFYDSLDNKSRNIIANIQNINIESSNLVKFAKKHPKFYAFITNIISPLGSACMYIYRIIKYKRSIDVKKKN